MNDYYKILEIQQSALKPIARYNKYVKIKLRTQDSKLKQLICDRLEYGNTDLAFDDLNNYCKNQIELQIPTWQVAAKEAGWQSPNKINTILNLGK